MATLDIPPGFSLIVDGDGSPVEQEGQVLLLRNEDKEQFWVVKKDITLVEDAMEHDEIKENQLVEADRKRKEWDEDETRHLICVITSYKTQLDESKIKKKTVFEDISAAMAEESNGKYFPTVTQCENRYKSLLKKYKEVSDYNNTTGNDRKEWEYFELMNQIFGGRPNVTPLAGCSSMQMVSSDTNKRTGSLQNVLSEKLDKRGSVIDKAIKKEKSKRRTKVRSELLSMMETMEQRAEERENRKLQVLQEQHKDYKNLMEKLVTAYLTPTFRRADWLEVGVDYQAQDASIAEKKPNATKPTSSQSSYTSPTLRGENERLAALASLQRPTYVEPPSSQATGSSTQATLDSGRFSEYFD